MATINAHLRNNSEPRFYCWPTCIQSQNRSQWRRIESYVSINTAPCALSLFLISSPHPWKFWTRHCKGVTRKVPSTCWDSCTQKKYEKNNVVLQAAKLTEKWQNSWPLWSISVLKGNVKTSMSVNRVESWLKLNEPKFLSKRYVQK